MATCQDPGLLTSVSVTSEPGRGQYEKTDGDL